MRTEVKIGIAVGVVLVVFAGIWIYLASRSHKSVAADNRAVNAPAVAAKGAENRSIDFLPPPERTLPDRTSISPTSDNGASSTTQPDVSSEHPTPPPPEALRIEEHPTPPIVRDSERSTTQPTDGTYTVKAGDSFWQIAQERYHDGSKYTLIEAANPGVSKDALTIGQKLVIPPLPEAAAKSGTHDVKDTEDPRGQVTAGQPENGQKTHTVKEGETLWSIAKIELGDATLYKQIEKANPGLKSSSTLRIGQKIVLPVGATSQPSGHGDSTAAKTAHAAPKTAHAPAKKAHSTVTPTVTGRPVWD